MLIPVVHERCGKFPARYKFIVLKDGEDKHGFLPILLAFLQARRESEAE